MEIVVNARRNAWGPVERSPLTIIIIVHQGLARAQRESHLIGLRDIDRAFNSTAVKRLNRGPDITCLKISVEKPNPLLALKHEAGRRKNDRLLIRASDR